MDSDMDEVLRFCEKDKEIQLFHRLVRDYLPFYRDREKMINSGLSKVCQRKSPNMVQFINLREQVLAVLCVGIKFDYSSFGWNMSWMTKLTDVGEAACNTFRVPLSLVKLGTVPEWSVTEALERLSKVAMLDSDGDSDSLSTVTISPTRAALNPSERSEGQNVSGIDRSTPRVQPEKKAPKRK